MALEMMTYVFDGVLDFDSKQEFVYKVRQESNALTGYKKDTLILSAIKDWLLFNQREVFLESLIMNSIYATFKVEHSISIEDAFAHFSFLNDLFFKTQIVKAWFSKFSIIDFHKRISLMNLSSIKLSDGSIFAGEDTWRGEYFWSLL